MNELIFGDPADYPELVGNLFTAEAVAAGLEGWVNLTEADKDLLVETARDALEWLHETAEPLPQEKMEP